MDLKLIEKYKALGIADILDHEKFNNISVVHHSTVLEGSTLTEVETQVLINEGLTPKGKPIIHSLMVTDHFSALKFILKEAGKKRPISVPLIQEINSLAIRNTGSVYNTILGVVDATKGEFRKGNVTAGNTYFPNYDKVKDLTRDLADKISGMMKSNISVVDQLRLSFDAHYSLVSIHPFYDGNGRTSRLLMNYIQHYYKLPLAIVHKENKADYIQALIDTREKQDLSVFRGFMDKEYTHLLKSEIQRFQEIKHPKKGRGFSFLF
ncbi:Fic family protein [Pedobacter sp. UYP30]|uniref:Fic family protein n=1 Tax=Pedobacter sp. UYP30 TaxID=1756400 RepID=UPI00339B037B